MTTPTPYTAAVDRAWERWPWLMDPRAAWNPTPDNYESIDRHSREAGEGRLDQRLIRVLAIDGGGVRGLVPSTLLEGIEERAGRPISDLFDVFVGTSTGGLLALGLNVPGEGGPKYSAADISAVYRENGARIFHRGKRHRLKTLGGLIGPRYPVTSLERILQELFGDTKLSEALRQTSVTTYDTERRTPVALCSDVHKWAEPRNPDVLMRHAARATSAAPTFFAPFLLPAVPDGRPGYDFGDRFSVVDGGVAANNPALWGMYESGVNNDASSLLLVSLGTGRAKDQFRYETLMRYGTINWLRPALELLADGANETTHAQLNYFLNGLWAAPRTQLGGKRIPPSSMETRLRAGGHDADYDINVALGGQRTKWTRYLRYQPDLVTASSAMDCVTPRNIAALAADARRFWDQHEADLTELADFLATMAELRPARPNPPAWDTWQLGGVPEFSGLGF